MQLTTGSRLFMVVTVVMPGSLLVIQKWFQQSYHSFVLAIGLLACQSIFPPEEGQSVFRVPAPLALGALQGARACRCSRETYRSSFSLFTGQMKTERLIQFAVSALRRLQHQTMRKRWPTVSVIINAGEFASSAQAARRLHSDGRRQKGDAGLNGGR